MFQEEDYIELSTSKLLASVGYEEIDIRCFYAEDEPGRGEVWYPKITLYEAQKWIWQSYKLLVTAFIKAPFGQPYEFIYCIQDAKNTIDDYGTIISDGSFNTYEAALNAGIYRACQMIKESKRKIEP
ncbi:hypothetical protein H6A66_11045 [Bacteroides caecigallinarum]|uniref:hypothetical protein n=1 Tax=Bacteroides caecigallinarum TaxID=1411144 RepID=UPI0019599932|nr:hypothetical protein [Bacteroides caecigallinarum]MBM6865699.1 hypothetical protein [Bacteroides caecigallinarum]